MLAWRTRRPVAALCAGLAVLVAVDRVRPADPPTVEVTVAARHLAADHVLTRDDVVRRDVPADLVPGRPAVAGARADPAADVLGRRLAVDVPAGLPLVPELLVDDDAGPPPGTVVVPVRFADAGVAALLRAGMRVDVIAAGQQDGAEPERLARDALVLAGAGGGSPGADEEDVGGGSGLLGGAAGTGGSDADVPVLLAVTPEESVTLGGAAGSRTLGAVIVG